MNLENIAKDLKDNPPINIELKAEADSEKHKQFFDHQCEYTRKDNPITGAIGGAITYQFTSTTLGNVIKMSCECGKTEDITDYRGW